MSSDPSPPRARGAPPLMAAALFASGFASLTNQVVWQRALKSFLGGSETLASMVVVLVFMGGLGIGALAMGRRARRLRRPVLALAGLELALAVVNAGVALVLASGLDASVRQVQVLAQASGVPLIVLYALGALGLLFVPTFLMGATIPVASEACQRALGYDDPAILPVLFFVNTLGSALGSLAGSFYLVPALGLQASLMVAVGANVAAGVGLLGLGRGEVAAAEGSPAGAAAARPFFPPSPDEALSFGLGAVSLAFEMALLRMAVILYSPLPSVFATILTGYLLTWSVGSWLSSRLARRWTLPRALGLTALALALVALVPATPGLAPEAAPRALGEVPWFLCRGGLFFLPSLLFGVLFGMILTRAAEDWGQDVGRLSAWNTAGSCLGTVAGTLVGYEMDWLLMPVVLALLVWVLQAVASGGRVGPRLAASICAGAVALTWDFTGALGGGATRCFFGADGAIFVTNGKAVVWDGLWHSALSDGEDHLGTRNWYLGVAPLLLHPTGEVRDACIIGLGTGITAATVAQQESVERVVAYDITLTLREVLEAYPEGTLGALENPELEIRWEDARMGLALREDERFDLIQAQPLWLKQAGSGLLNSVEFYRLVASRLKPGGVFCLYSNGTPGQAFVARQTAAQVFPHGESFFSGYLLVLSNDPLTWDRPSVERVWARLRDDPLGRELARVPETSGVEALLALPDRPRLPWGDGRLISTDDHPRIEYPRWIDGWIRERGYATALPAPALATRE